jgi:hypothetical protein
MTPRLAQTLSLLAALAAGAVFGQSSEQFTEIEYDESGRVVSVETVVELAAPSVAGIEPAVLRHGPPRTVTVAGAGLRGVTVTGSHPGVVISAVSTSEKLVRLQVQVDEPVPLGEQASCPGAFGVVGAQGCGA